MQLKDTVDKNKTFDISSITDDILSGDIDPYDILDNEVDAKSVMDSVETLLNFEKLLQEHDDAIYDSYQDIDDEFDEEFDTLDI